MFFKILTADYFNYILNPTLGFELFVLTMNNKKILI